MNRRASVEQTALWDNGGDRARGVALMRIYECSRCHESKHLEVPPPERACRGCHEKVAQGTLEGASVEELNHYRKHLKHFVQVPSLEYTEVRFRNEWLIRFLQEPHDLRPGLEETMPRLSINEQQARDIAAVLAPERGTNELSGRGDAEQGKQLFEAKRCGRCHAFGENRPALSEQGREPLAALAPDLSHVRHRFRLENLVAWLREPSALVPNTRMPNHGFSETEARNVARFLVTASASYTVSKDKSVSIPDREVFFEEVSEKVFRDTCWHCHSDPDFSKGDEGPGNIGGFGFAGVGLELASYEGVLGGAYPSGYTVLNMPRERTRESIVDLTHPSKSRLIRALRARQVEERGGSVPGVRGMPLGLPALEEEQIALVEAWMAQGAK